MSCTYSRRVHAEIRRLSVGHAMGIAIVGSAIAGAAMALSAYPGSTYGVCQSLRTAEVLLISFTAWLSRICALLLRSTRRFL